MLSNFLHSKIQIFKVNKLFIVRKTTSQNKKAFMEENIEKNTVIKVNISKYKCINFTNLTFPS